MTFEEWYENHVKYMTLTDFKPWLYEAWMAAREDSAKVCDTAIIPNPTTSMFDAGCNSALNMCAETIRRLR